MMRSITSSRQGIPEQTKLIIQQYIERDSVTTARAIVKQLEFEKENNPDIYIPTYLQINNFKHNHNHSKNPGKFSFGELSEILQNQSQLYLQAHRRHMFNEKHLSRFNNHNTNDSQKSTDRTKAN